MNLPAGGLVGASTVLAGTRAATLVLQAVHFGVMARMLDTNTFAGLVAAMALLAIGQAVTEFGLLSTVVLTLQDRKGEEGRVLGDAVLATALLGVGGLVLAVFVALLALPAEGVRALLLLIPWFALTALQLPFAAMRRHALQSRRLAAADGLGRMVPLVLLVPVAVAGQDWSSTEKVAAIVAGMGAGALVALAVLVPQKWAGLLAGGRPRQAWRLVAQSAPLGATSTVSLLHARVDQVVLSGYGLRLQLGAYAVAYRVLDAALAVVMAAGAAAFPLLARTAGSDRVAIARLQARLLASVAVLSGIAAFLFAPQLVVLVGGDQYRDAAPLLRLLAPALVLSVLNVGPAHVAIVEGRVRPLLRIAVLGVACNLGLNLALVPAHGARAAALTTVASELVGFVLVARLASRALPGSVSATAVGGAICAFAAGSWGALWAWREIGPLAGAGAVAVAMAILVATVVWPALAHRRAKRDLEARGGRVKVLNVITSLVVGGAQETAMRYCSRLDPSRFEAKLVCGPDLGPEGNLFEVARRQAVEVLTVPRLHRPMRPVADTLALVALFRLFLRERPTIVHTHSSKAGQLGRLAARLAGVPVVMHTVHGWSFHDGMHPAPRSAAVFVERLTARLTTSLVVVADRDRRTGVERRIGRPDQYTLVRSAIELDEYRPRPGATAAARRAIGLDAATPVVGTVTRFLPQKDPVTLVRAFALVAERVPGSRLVVVGDGPMRARVEALLAELGIQDRVTLLGPRTDVASILPAFDVFVSSSRWEGLPRVIVEAATAGVPVVATDVGGNAELLVHGESGMLVPAGDTEALAAAMTAVVSHKDLARSLRRMAMEAVAPFDISVMIRDLEALYLSSVFWASEREVGDVDGHRPQPAGELELELGVADVDHGAAAAVGRRRLATGGEGDAKAVQIPLRSA